MLAAKSADEAKAAQAKICYSETFKKKKKPLRERKDTTCISPLKTGYFPILRVMFKLFLFESKIRFEMFYPILKLLLFRNKRRSTVRMTTVISLADGHFDS